MARCSSQILKINEYRVHRWSLRLILLDRLQNLQISVVYSTVCIEQVHVEVRARSPIAGKSNSLHSLCLIVFISILISYS